MTTPTKQIIRSCGTWLVCGITGILLSGCVGNSGFNQGPSSVRVISDEPVRSAFSAAALRHEKTSSTTVLSLPNDKLSSAEPTYSTSKAGEFSSLQDGQMETAEIKSLFSGLEVNAEDDIPEIHRFDDNGFVDGVAVSGRDRSISSGTSEEDFGSWSVTPKSRICLDWIDWYSGDPSCFSVTKSGGRLLLNGKRRTFVYQVLN